jgi:hypothetical protein
MELKPFNLDEIFHLDMQSTEVQNWTILCMLTGAVNAATFKPSEKTILEIFIDKYPPTQHRFDYYNTINVITFGLLFTNRKEILEKDINLEEFKDLLLTATPFYYEFLNNHFKKTFIENMDKDHHITYLIEQNTDYMIKKYHEVWLKIKTEHSFSKLNSELHENSEKKSTLKKKL